jgi:alkylated DNA repair dioxygenase AlkB
MSEEQLGFFGAKPNLPEGFKYSPGVLSVAEEERLLEEFKSLPFKEFEFHGFTGKRRTVSYGWKYDYTARLLRKVDDIPPFLLSVRELAGAFAGVPAAKLQQALVTEYDAEAGIGWHRDKPQFGDVIGISLKSSCVFRLRRKSGTRWERASITAEPRSAYLMRGPSRTEWEHSIPGVEALRYSITFRNFRDDIE